MLSERGDTAFTGLPDLATDIVRRVRLDDPMKSKQMRKGLEDLAEEGVIRIFKPAIGSNWIVGVVGALQLDVLGTRMEAEYGLKLGFEASPWDVARRSEERRVGKECRSRRSPEREKKNGKRR